MDKALIQLVAAFIGSIGFSLIFNVEKKYLFAAAFGGFLNWGAFLLCDGVFKMDVFVATVIAAAVCQIYAEVLARVYKAPTTVFFIPGVVPLIPGGSLYNTMYSAVFRDWVSFRKYGTQTLLGTLGIAVGLSFVSGILYVVANRAKQRASKK